MFLVLAHTKTTIYTTSQQFVFECYQLSRLLPQEEKYAMSSQLRRAAVSVHLNIAEGCSRKSSVERKRFFEISRGSLIEIDAALDLALMLNYCNHSDFKAIGELMVSIFKQLCGLLKTT